MKAILRFTCLLVVGVIFQPQAQATNGSLQKKITSVISPYIEQGMFQGNILLVKDGEVILQLSSVFSDATQQQLIGPASSFPIASLSKPVVATLALKLQEQGVFDLKKTLDNYLPDFHAAWASQVTLHHLLANRSGLPGHYLLPGWQSGRFKSDVPKQTLLDEIAQMKLQFSPGSHYAYTNLGWLLMGEVIERTTGKTLAQNLQSQIFTPLSMTHSGLVFQSNTPLVTGFRWGNEGGWHPQPTLSMQVFNVGAGLYSTSFDLVRYLDALHHGDLLTSASKQQMFSDHAPYGWRTETLSLSAGINRQIHSYDGQLQGHSSLLYHILQDNISLVILTNTGMGFEHKKRLAEDILSAYYNAPYPDRYESTPSLKLHQSLLDNQWTDTFALLQLQPIQNQQTAILIKDLAQQLQWSGLLDKAIDLYTWLANSFPEHEELKQQLATLCKQNATQIACQSRPHINVGMTVLPLTDPERSAWRSKAPRPMTTHLFYPTTEDNTQPVHLGPANTPLFTAGTVVQNARPINQKRPLILMSHGTGGSALQLLWLAEALVKQGYLVAAINHHGNTAFETQKYPEGFLLWWERARDLQVVQQQLIRDSQWAELIDTNKVAAVGFSLGGYTALSALGAITDKNLFNQYCQNAVADFSCQPQPEFTDVLDAYEKVKDSAQVLRSNKRQESSYKIAGLRAAVVIAPAIVHAFRPESLASISTPTLFLVGSQDTIAPAKSNAEYAFGLLPDSQIEVIENSHHYSFLSLCTEHGERFVPELCDEPYSLTREQAHQQAIELTLTFLAKYLQ